MERDNEKNGDTIKAKDETVLAKPFLKWAGGKSQLIDELSARIPKSMLQTGKIDTYIEPFVGGGAFFFHLKGRFDIKESYLFDVNREIIVAYKVIQGNHKELISTLKELEDGFIPKDDKGRNDFFYRIRETFNRGMSDFNYGEYNDEWITRAAYLIFMNKTCFNGLYRINSKGGFNVPCGKYKNPTICDKENLRRVSSALKGTEIVCGDFSESSRYIKEGSLVYLDPPYRPLTKTSSFTSYTKECFTEDDQIRLADFFKEMNGRKAYLMLSNSDPRNEDPDDDFFDGLYKGFHIERVNAKRVINCDPKGRGEIKELIIRNFE